MPLPPSTPMMAFSLSQSWFHKRQITPSEDKRFKPRDTENNEPLITQTASKTGSLPHQELNINLLQPSKHINPSGDREQHTFCDISPG